ncbi:glyoxylase-like metal-dependent hydrolase (beta-lactamase superfamily II) [Devosia sp. UYZn731]|uniref:MBL fold metallo-hydrolase n=1 Tax=Devosia sp. UYZn731 TaxID=3156345 RepID=UPI003390C95E
MTIFLCATCGTSFPDSATPPAACPICDDERQYVPASGQAWTTRDALAKTYRNAWQHHEPNLFSIQPVPALGINQRAFLLRTPSGNVLWDCVALLDDATKALVDSLGGIAAIAISHPHYYTVMQDWAEAFGATIHLHAADAAHIVRPDANVHLWHEETRQLLPGVTLIRAGGHFDGGTVLHWADTEDKAGAMLVGDILQVTPGGHRVSFMWSYPNMMPLSAVKIRHVTDAIAPWRYDRIYGAFAGQYIPTDAPAIVARSAARYIELIA